MTEALLLGRRAVREIARYPEATIPALFIPLFFLAVNIGQVSETFPDTTPFLRGQGYVAFQMPVSLMFAVATASSGLALVTEIDKVRTSPRGSAANLSSTLRVYVLRQVKRKISRA